VIRLLLFSMAILAQDADRDGLSDRDEECLIRQFTPRFFISGTECDRLPAEIKPGLRDPVVVERNGTIYARAFPVRRGVEIHYYHLWANDCGRMGHAWDVEHVSVLIENGKATYWLAAAHQDTVCDAANAAAARSIHAETHGATFWISRGKHATFLSEKLCRRGCGGDFCDKPEVMPVARVINIGERGAALNGAEWIHSSEWPLEGKLVSDFPEELLAAVPKKGAAFVYPVMIPGQSVVLGFNAAIDGVGTGERHTRRALVRARKWVESKTSAR
jgi:hypothetical protein